MVRNTIRLMESYPKEYLLFSILKYLLNNDTYIVYMNKIIPVRILKKNGIHLLLNFRMQKCCLSISR